MLDVIINSALFLSEENVSAWTINDGVTPPVRYMRTSLLDDDASFCGRSTKQILNLEDFRGLQDGKNLFWDKYL